MIAVSAIKNLTVEGATPPSTVVGERNYPKVPVIFNIPPNVVGNQAKDFDNPEGWWGVYTLTDIINKRSYMISTIMKADVTRPEVLYEKEVSVAAVSSKPVESEAKLKKPPIPKLVFKASIDPVGPSAEVERLKVIGNASLDRKLEVLIWDDVKAKEAILELHFKGLDFYTIVRALSLGLFGRRINRRLVPTRWAITAVDRTIANNLLKQVRFYPEVPHVMINEAKYLHNKFTIITYPGRYRIEWVEMWYPSTVYTSFAEEPVIIYNKDDALGHVRTLDGGFEAARFALINHLFKIRRRAAAIIIREIGPGYYASVGNWHIRLTVEKALSKPGMKFNSLDEALKFLSIKSLPMKRYVIPILRKMRSKDITSYFK
jgi:hypothetical protein